MFTRALPLLCLGLSIAAAPLKVACVGDSITEGTFLSNPALESYPARLGKLYSTNQFVVRNFGVSGRTLLKQGDFPYWKETAFTNSQTFGPDIVVIQLGTNDGKPYNWRYGTNFISDYKAMVALYQNLPSAPKVYVCAPCPVFGAGAYDIVPGIIRTNIAPAVRQIANDLSLPLIDLNARLTNSAWFPDTVHPNSKGASAMASAIFETLSGGLPNETPPTLVMQRVSAGRVILSWPAKWGALVPETANPLLSTNTAWSIIESGIPTSDGTTIRQTNSFGAGARYFQLARP